MGNPLSQGSDVIAMKKSHHQMTYWFFHHPVAAVILPIYILQEKRPDVLIPLPED
jgi:hypothetical protein